MTAPSYMNSFIHLPCDLLKKLGIHLQMTLYELKLKIKIFFPLSYSSPDIDECQQNVMLCGDYGNCTNLPGSYECSCIEGYTRVNDQCVGRYSGCMVSKLDIYLFHNN